VFLRLLPFILSIAAKQLKKRQAADAKRGTSKGRGRSSAPARRRR
jgi:hypothetical protein